MNFFAALALLPGLWWDRGPETAADLKRAGISQVYVQTACAAGWREAGVSCTVLDVSSFPKVPKPGVKYRADVAAATSLPWVDANGWRYERGQRQAFYADLPAGSAPLAAAEAAMYGVTAVLRADPADIAPLGAMTKFLAKIENPALPVVANIGIVDDGSPEIGEVLNLLSRRNLLYRALKTPDPQLTMNIKLDTPDYPRQDAKNPAAFANQVRYRLTDDKRLVRLYGSQVMVVRLTGDSQRCRLHLLNYGKPKAVDVRVRLLGHWRDGRLAADGWPEAALSEIKQDEGATEFTVPQVNTYAVVDFVRQR